MNHAEAVTPSSALRPQRGLWGLAAALALAATAAVCLRTTQLTAAESYTAAYRDRLAMWAAGTKAATTDDLSAAEHDLKLALTVRPHDGGTHELLGALYTMRAMQDWEALPQRNLWLEAAKTEFTASATLRPFLPQPQANLALVTSMQEHVPADEVFRHWNAALALGPHEKDTRVQLLNVSLAMWDEAPTGAKNWVNDLRSSRVYSDAMWQRWGVYYGIESMQ